MEKLTAQLLVTVLLALSAEPAASQEILAKQSQDTLSDTLAKIPRVLEEVVVSAGAFDASDKAKGASLTPIDAVTVAGSNNDLTIALRALPGTQQIGEQEGLFVRGGTGAETKQFIDGMLVRHPNFPSVPGIQQYSRIDPFLFKGILFSTGGYSALYGQAMSSALILESIDIPDETSASFSLFPANAGAGFQKRADDGNSGYGINIGYSNHQWYNSVVRQRPRYFNGPEYLQGDANYRTKIGGQGMFKLYTNWSKSRVGFDIPDINNLALRSALLVAGDNTYSNASLRHYLADSWRLDAGVAYSFLRTVNDRWLAMADGQPVTAVDMLSDETDGDSDIREHFAQGRVVLTKRFARNRAIRFGGEYFYTHERGQWLDVPVSLTDHLGAAFAETDLALADGVALRIGGRAEYASVISRWALAPRVSLAYRFARAHQLNVAYGIFYQEPESMYLYAPKGAGLDFSSADHYLMNYTYKANNRFLRAEWYHKRYRNLVRTTPRIRTSGTGFANGFELFFRDKRSIRDLDYWVTYTYLNTSREYLDYPGRLEPTFSAPHTGTLAVKKFIPSWSANVNISYSFATGRPYYDIYRDPQSADTRVRHAGTTRPYSVVNLHVAYITRFFKKSKLRNFSGFAGGVNNVLGAKQVFGYRFSADGKHRAAITLPAPRYYFIGVFMSWGVDRTGDFLENQL